MMKEMIKGWLGLLRRRGTRRFTQSSRPSETARKSNFNKMLTSYEELLKAFDKAKPVIAKEEAGVTPRFFLRILVEMEDLINETWEDSVGRKNMSKVNGKSLGALRQKLRKYIRENLDDDVAKFRENPDADDDEGDEAADEEGSDADDNEGLT